MPMSSDEARLIQAAKRGERAAFAEIFERHYDAVYTYLFYRCGDPMLAEDLAGEVFLRLVEKISSYTYRGQPILAWLYTVARNLLTDSYRQAGRNDLVSLEERIVATSPNPSETAERRLEQACLARAMQHLGESHRQVILLRFIEGRSHAEAAQILGRTENATKVLQHRALKALRRALETEGCYDE
jgi:RNA polymerase sigma-70 factor (ECF subfamily)